mmetsp:Transcript_1245/g.3041  ORF Transcript_1245/g.3041 Transcript_1245/m.3041 type:complete len:222 (+) Transcript_1245:75-740(+)
MRCRRHANNGRLAQWLPPATKDCLKSRRARGATQTDAASRQATQGPVELRERRQPTSPLGFARHETGGVRKTVFIGLPPDLLRRYSVLWQGHQICLSAELPLEVALKALAVPPGGNGGLSRLHKFDEHGRPLGRSEGLQEVYDPHSEHLDFVAIYPGKLPHRAANLPRDATRRLVRRRGRRARKPPHPQQQGVVHQASTNQEIYVLANALHELFPLGSWQV